MNDDMPIMNDDMPYMYDDVPYMKDDTPYMTAYPWLERYHVPWGAIFMVKLYHVSKFQFKSTFGSSVSLISLIRPNLAN